MKVKEEARADGPTTLIGVERTVRILQAVEEAESSNLADIGRSTKLNEATVLRYLNSLTALGFIERDEVGQYRLGWEVFRLGQRALADRVPRGAIRPAMEALAAEFNETVNFAVVRNGQIVLIDVLESSRAVKKINVVGQIDPWHASALGKAVLSTMPDSEWRNILKQAERQRFTSHTITALDKLATEIKATKKRGYAIDREEVDEELSCIAAPIPTSTGQPSQSALSISFVSHRLTPKTLDEAAAQVVAAAKEIARRLP